MKAGLSMTYDGKLLARARAELEKDRAANRDEMLRRQGEVYARVPEIREIDTALRAQMARLVRLTISKSPALADELEQLKEENLNLQMLGFDTEASEKYSAIAAPIDIAGNRNGTLFMYRVSKPYSIDDIILAEYATTVVGLEIVRSKNEESAAVLRGQKVAESAFASLSVMEAEAVRQVFDELQGTEGILVTSRVADKARITRSVIVNALRKLESAGVIESRSSGMKGTYIKVLNDNIFAFLTPDQQ